MLEKTLKFFGMENKVDLSPEGIDQLKVLATLIGIMAGLFFGLIIPWGYGCIQIGILIFT